MMKFKILCSVVILATMASYPKTVPTPRVSLLMLAPHNSKHKSDWEVVLGLGDTADAGAWNCFGGYHDGQESVSTAAVHSFFKDSLFGKVFSVSAEQVKAYLEAASIYTFAFPDNALMFVVPFGDSVINTYLTGFYDSLYHQQRKTRYAKRRGIAVPSITKVALVAWDELMHVLEKSTAEQNITVSARVASKRTRAKKGEPHFVTEAISLDPLLCKQLAYVAENRPYTKGLKAGMRVYS